MTEGSKAVVLLSGGLDSATALAVARHEGFDCHALSFDYGQRHRIELDAAARVAESIGVARHVTVKFDLGTWGGSALTGDEGVPKDRRLDEEGVPRTYVPGRNTIFLSFALSWAEAIGADDIFIGANALDYSGYPDCRPEFLSAFQKVAEQGTRAGLEGHAPRIRAPLLHLSKAAIIKLGISLGVDYSLTRSCYDPDESGKACGRCDSCRLRRKGFLEAGVRDPIQYACS